jgi:ABC-type Fe3+ transport system permease subunit
VFSERFSQGWELFEWSQVSKPLSFTFLQAFLSTILTLVVGLPAAWLFAKFDFPDAKDCAPSACFPSSCRRLWWQRPSTRS